MYDPQTRKKKKAGKRNCECDQMLNLTEKYFKITTINMFTDAKETIIKVVRKGVNDNVASNKVYQQKHRNYKYF